MRFRFATWNVNAFRRLSGHAALIRSVDCDLLALQELTQTSYDNLAASGYLIGRRFRSHYAPRSQVREEHGVWAALYLAGPPLL